MKIFITSAQMLSTCPKCGEPSTGSFGSEDDGDDDPTRLAELRCVNCGHKSTYAFKPEIEGELA